MVRLHYSLSTFPVCFSPKELEVFKDASPLSPATSLMNHVLYYFKMLRSRCFLGMLLIFQTGSLVSDSSVTFFEFLGMIQTDQLLFCKHSKQTDFYQATGLHWPYELSSLFAPGLLRSERKGFIYHHGSADRNIWLWTRFPVYYWGKNRTIKALRLSSQGHQMS